MLSFMNFFGLPARSIHFASDTSFLTYTDQVFTDAPSQHFLEYEAQIFQPARITSLAQFC
jgi:hypothetical protein